MNKKKVATMVVALSLVAIVGLGATLAYFTDKTDTKTNIVTMGKVDINLTEDGSGDEIDSGFEYKDVMPGDTLSKIPVVTVEEDSQAAYVRVKITPVIDAKLTAAGITEEAIIACLDIKSEELVKGTDGYYYFQGIKNANDKLTVFTTVTIPTTWDNAVANGGFTISIDAEAIQADNVDPILEGEKIVGWPAAEIKALN